MPNDTNSNGAGSTANTNNLNTQQVNKQGNNNVIEIDLLDMCSYYLSHWKVILVAFIIGAALGFCYQHFLVGTTYVADSSIFVADTGNSIDITDLTMSSELSIDYQKILTSRRTRKEVIADLGLDMDYEDLGKLLSISQTDESHIITISVTTDNRKLSREIANSMVRIGSQRIQEVTTTGDPAVVDYATADAVVAVNYGLRKYPAIGGLLVAFIPIIILLIQYLMDNSFKSEDEVVGKLNKPVLSGVPYYGERNLVTSSLNYYEKEAFNTLYGNISLSGVDNRAIAITSANANEGKSSLSFKLAEITTDFNKRVCYVDCDMRNSYFCKLYGIDKNINPGLSGYLSGQADISDVLIKDEKNSRLFIIPAGKNPPNPSALLSGDRFEQLIRALRANFDYIILDTPPVNAVIDGIFIAKQCDGTVLVLESYGTDSKQAVRALNDLLLSNVNVLGVVVNKIGRKKGYGYGYGYGRKKKYGYGYGKGYGKGGYGKGYGYGKAYGYGYGYGHVEGDKAAANTTAKSGRKSTKNSKDKKSTTDKK